MGAHLGGALDLTDVADPFGASIYGDTVRAPGPLAGGQAGYNWQFGRALIGLEADVSWADLFGTETCFAYSGFYVSANCRAEVDAARHDRSAVRLARWSRRQHLALRQGGWRLELQQRRRDDERRSRISDHGCEPRSLGMDARRWRRARHLAALVAQGGVRLSVVWQPRLVDADRRLPVGPLSRSQPDDSGGLDGDRLFAGHPSLQGRAQLPARRQAADDDRSMRASLRSRLYPVRRSRSARAMSTAGVASRKTSAFPGPDHHRSPRASPIPI